jgi:hypothetical protein
VPAPASTGPAADLPTALLRRLPVAAVALFVVLGALERWWVASHHLGTLTSDGSVVGLMALHLLHHGQLPAYFWGQSYGGSLEAVLTAAVFGVAGVGTAQLVSATALSSALAALALWRTGRRIVGEPAALIGALAFWVWPANVIWRSLKPGGTYWLGLALALCAVNLLVRIHEGDDRWWTRAGAGALCGLAFWCSPLSTQLLVPALLWCSPALWRLGRRFGLVVLGALVGAFPAIVFGATHAWSNLRVPGGNRGIFVGVAGRFFSFFRLEAPIAVSLRTEGNFRWVAGAFGVVLLLAVYVGLLGLAYLVLTGRAKRCRLPLLTVALLPVLFAFNPLDDHPGQGRYVMFGLSMGALLVGVGIERAGDALAAAWRWLRAEVAWTVGLALLAVLGIAGVVSDPPLLIAGFNAPDVPMPFDDSGLQAMVAAHHVRFAYAPYWVSYRLTFETQESTIASPDDLVRYRPYAAEVSASRAPAYLFVSSSAAVGRLEAWCRAHGIAVEAWSRGGFTVVQPATRVTPLEVGKGVLQPR